MQESSQITWDPASINHHVPWESRLFVLYLLVVVAISFVRILHVLRQLWSFTHGSVLMRSGENEFLYAWETCSAKIQSMKRLVFFTLLLSVLVAVYRLRTTLTQLVAQKAFGVGAFGGTVVEVLTLFALGILVCALLYAPCGLCEGMLLRRRAAWNHSFAGTKSGA